MRQTQPAQAYADSARIFLQPLIKRDSLNPNWHVFLGLCYALLDHKNEAITEGRMAAELLPVSLDAVEGPDIIAGLAEIYILVGEHDAAIDQYAYLLSIPSSIMLPGLRHYPLLDPLREHPRFKELLAKYSVAQK